jgi:uncharacterized membrane protein YfcA
MDFRLFALMVVAGTLGAALGMRISRTLRRKKERGRKPPSPPKP